MPAHSELHGGFDPQGAPLAAPGLWLIGEAARRVELDPKTIRYYERCGLVVPRRLGQIRVFGPVDMEKLRLVKCMRMLEMPIPEIRTAMQVVSRNSHESDEALSQQVKNLLGQHLRQLEERFLRLRASVDHICAVPPLPANEASAPTALPEPSRPDR